MAAMAAVHILLIFIIVLQSFWVSAITDIILLEFKQGLQNSASLDEAWKNGTNPCDSNWRGVECDSGKNVTGLILVNLGLSGNINIDSLEKLGKLRFISLENNSFSGPIPAFNRLTSLRSLYLSGNQFSGVIPPDYFMNMGSIKKLELSRNNFSGNIPPSIGQLDMLLIVFLERNEFSGRVPSISQNSLQRINLSFNKLQGEVPTGMSKFGREPFDGNPDLCGSFLGKPCSSNMNVPSNGQESSNNDDGSMSPSSTTKWMILTIVVAVLLVTIFFNKGKKGEKSFNVLGKENLDDKVHFHMPFSTRASLSSSRKGGSSRGSHSLKKGPPSSKHGNELVMVNEDKGIFGLQDLMKAAAEVIGNCGLGSAYKAVLGNGVQVVVKRFRDMNKLNKDAFDSQLRRLGRIRHRNILPPLAYHYRKDEKLLVSEFVPRGSLMFLLHGDRGVAHAELTWPVRLKIIKGVARGMGFLHAEFANYALPHGNLKSSNILISLNYEPLLVDYALYSLVSNTQSEQTLFACKCPEVVFSNQLSPKCDVYCLGIVILEIITGKYPCQYLSKHSGGTDVVQWAKEEIYGDRIFDLIDPEIVNSSTSLSPMEKMLKIGADCTESDQGKRIEMKEALRKIEEIQG